MEFTITRETKRFLYILGGLIGCTVSCKKEMFFIAVGFISIYFGFILLADLIGV